MLAAADPDIPGQQGGGGGVEKEAAARQRRAADAAADADALAARHRSLVQRRRRVRSALRVLEVSESGRAALETGAAGAERAGGRSARADEAMKVDACEHRGHCCGRRPRFGWVGKCGSVDVHRRYVTYLRPLPGLYNIVWRFF